MKVHLLRMFDGQTIRIHEIQPGVFACPVCGFDLGNMPPWSEGYAMRPDGSRTELRASASHEICPSCDTEFGYDDAEEGISQEECWHRLRERWLAGTDDKERARVQLKNIGIILD
jgi:hypothetical protein